MKVTFNRNVKHDGRIYEQGHTYDFDGEMTPELQALLELKHDEVFTQKSTNEVEQPVSVQVAEVAPEDAKAEAQPEPVAKTVSVNKSSNPMMPPAPNITG